MSVQDSRVETAICQPVEYFHCPVSRGKTGELGSLSIPADGMLGVGSRETSLIVIFYGEPIQKSTV